MAVADIAERPGLYPGKKYGMQTLVAPVGRINGNIKWVVLCDCGHQRELFYSAFRRGGSCGCDVQRRMLATRRANRTFTDLTGKRFGRLIALERVDVPGLRDTRWRCLCDCGAEALKDIAALNDGSTNKCRHACPLGPINSTRTHGESHSARLYRIWTNMRSRCTNPRASRWGRYGARGIAICTAWQSYEAFRDWALATGYADGLSIDRIDNDGNYEPGNCRWATAKEQANNRG